MVLKYLAHDIKSPRVKVIVPQTSSSNKQTALAKAQRRRLFCLLLLANIIVLNAVYGLSTAEKNTPIWEAITTDNLIYKLWTKYPLTSKSPQKGIVNGILFDEENPAALIDNQLVHEGDTIGGVNVVRISPEKIQFEKNGRVWTQRVQEKSIAAW